MAGRQGSSRYEMGQTTRSEWESDMRAHRELLRNVIEEHREGRGDAANWGSMIDELALPEEVVHAPISALGSANPPNSAQGPSGWIYHSTSLFCLRPHHLFLTQQLADFLAWLSSDDGQIEILALE